METKSLTILINESVMLMRGVGYSEKSILRFKQIWDSKLNNFMSVKGFEHYSTSIGEAFLATLPEEKMLMSSHLRRSITILDSVLQSGSISRYIPQKQEFDFSGEIGSVFLQLIDYKRAMRVSPNTLYVYTRVLGRLLTFLHLKSIDTLEDVSDKLLLEFVDSSQINPGHRFQVVKGLCKFLVGQGYKPPYFGMLVKGFKFPMREKLPSVYSTEEITAIGSAINRKELGGKRLYAAFLLGAILGLRRSDIINLTFSNIDWEHNTISLFQEKTKKRVELPLTKEVGSALIDYLKNERKNDCADKHVFLTLKPPFQKMSVNTLYVGIQTAIWASGVNVERRHHGIHAMRHSLVTRLLKDGQPLPMIANVLGHSSSNSTKSYLRVDMDGLKKCLLPIPPVPLTFYEQKGGIFYE